MAWRHIGFEVERLRIKAAELCSFELFYVLIDKKSNFTFIIDYFLFFYVVFKKKYYFCNCNFAFNRKTC